MPSRNAAHRMNPTCDDGSVAGSLAGAVTVAALPLFVVSQWFAIKWGLPARPVFNLVFLAAASVIVVAGYGRLRSIRWEVAIWLGLVAVVAVSIAVNGVPASVALRGSLPYLAPPFVALAALVAAPRRRAVDTAVTVAAATGGVLAATAVVQLAAGRTGYVLFGQDLAYPRWWERGRATGLVANPGRLAQVAASIVPMVARRGRWWVAAAATAGVAAAASGSRTALGAGIVLAVSAVVVGRWSGRAAMLGGAVALVVAFVLFQTLVPAARQDLAARVEATVSDSAGALTDVRVANLRSGLALLSDRPILGAGPGRFGSTTAFATRSELHERYGLPDVRSPEFVEELRRRGDDREIDVGVAQLDLGFLQVATELGLAGLALLGAFLASLVVRAWRARSPAALGLVALAALFSVTGPGIVDFSLAALVFWWFGVTVSGGDRG